MVLAFIHHPNTAHASANPDGSGGRRQGDRSAGILPFPASAHPQRFVKRFGRSTELWKAFHPNLSSVACGGKPQRPRATTDGKPR
jgi:hypothetical protein